MVMRKLSIFCCLLGMPCIGWAQTGGASWAKLNELRVGQRIEVVEMGLKKHRGTFVAVSDEAIRFREGTVVPPQRARRHQQEVWHGRVPKASDPELRTVVRKDSL
jgi:hypothetical protein